MCLDVMTALSHLRWLTLSDDAFVPLDEDLPVEEAMAKAMGKPLPPSLKAAKFNMNEFIYADPKPGGSSSGAIYSINLRVKNI